MSATIKPTKKTGGIIQRIGQQITHHDGQRNTDRILDQHAHGLGGIVQHINAIE
jgi:hypothetical protein